MKFRPKPVSIILPERISLAELCGVRISRNDFQNMPSNRRQQLGRGLIPLCCNIPCGEGLDLSGEAFELSGEEWVTSPSAVVVQRFLMAAIGVATFLQCAVVESAGFTKLPVKCFRLEACRE